MNQTITNVDSDDKKIKVDWFDLKKKSSSAQSKEINSHIFFLSLITSSVRDCYHISSSISRSPLLKVSLPLYTIFTFHLHLPCVDQIVYVDPCPISLLLKCLGSSYKAESYRSVIISSSTYIWAPEPITPTIIM